MDLIGTSFHISSIGNLKILEIYDFYDKPILYSAESLSGLIYLILWIDSEDDFDKWLYLPISRERLKRVKRNEITLYETFLNPEDGFEWIVTTFKNGVTNSSQINPNEINKEEYLPNSEFYMDFNAEDNTFEDDLQTKSKRINKNILSISLKLSNNNRKHNIEAEFLGKHLIFSEDILKNIFVKNSNKLNSIENFFSISPENFKIGSFRMDLEAGNEQLSFFDENIDNSLVIFMNLLSAKDDKDKLDELNKYISFEARDSYRSMLKNLKKFKSEMITKLYNPLKEKSLTVTLTENNVVSIINILDKFNDKKEETKNYRGKFDTVTANPKKNFNFTIIDGDVQYISGKISKSLLNKTGFELIVNNSNTRYYEIEVKKITKKKEFKSPVIKYELINYKEIELRQLTQHT